MRRFLLPITTLLFSIGCFAQQASSNDQTKQLQIYEDSLSSLGKKFVNDENEQNRKNANYTFIKTLVSALKTPNSFLFPFDSVKSISILKSPDGKFRIFSWPVKNDDGSYRFYGAIQMNTGGNLQLFPLEDDTPEIKNPEDSIFSNRKWFGAMYYKIIPVEAAKPYYVLLGWKGNTYKTTKKVIDALSFKAGKPQLGLGVFYGNGKTRKRVVFQYTSNASMLLRFEAKDNLIVFDHLSPPDQKLAKQLDTYGPDLSYDGYRLKNGAWSYIKNLDMRNVPDGQDANYNDPKKLRELDKATASKRE